MLRRLERSARLAIAVRQRVLFLLEAQEGVGGEHIVEVHQVLDQVEFLFSRLVVGIELQRLLKLVLSAFVLAC